MEKKEIHRMVKMRGARIHDVVDGEAEDGRDQRWGCFGFFRACYLYVREGVTQGHGAGGGEADSPPLLLQSPGQLFKLHLLLPD